MPNPAKVRCPVCQTINPWGALFCNGCGARFIAPIIQPNKGMDSKALAGIITLGMLGLCGFCGLIGSIKQNREAKVENTNVNQPVNISTPLPKEDFVAIKKKTDVLLGMSNTTTYTIDELKPFDQVRNQLKEIPKEDKISKKPRL